MNEELKTFTPIDPATVYTPPKRSGWAYFKDVAEIVTAMAWFALCIYLYGVYHWNGTGCFFLSAPGIMLMLDGLGDN